MIKVKIGEQSYPAQILDHDRDEDLGGLDSKEIILTSDFDSVSSLFIDNAIWSIIEEADEESYEYDCSEYSVAGPIKDFRNGLISVKMGKCETVIDNQILDILLGEEK